MKQLFLFSLALLVAGFGFAQTDLQPAAIVRLTKSEPITVKQFRTEVERMEKSAGRPLSATERRQVLEVMINERLVIQAADRDKVIIADTEVNQQLTQMRNARAQSTGRQMTDVEFALAVREETGLELAAFREQIRRQLIMQKYLLTKKQSLFSSIKQPTDAEILNMYNLAKAQFVRPDTVRFSLIQTSYANTAERPKAKETIDRLSREIGKNPSKFDEAVLRSQVPNSGYQAGEGGYLPRIVQAAQRFGQDFINSAFSLKQGEVSNVLEGPRSFSIIKVTETYSMKALELDDLAQLGSRITVKDYIRNTMLQDQQQQVLEKASAELVSELRTGNPFQILENNLKW
ncbi:peptidyl-prolyl cis-trans isomerase [Breznakiellaceae bacterium SP9]